MHTAAPHTPKSTASKLISSMRSISVSKRKHPDAREHSRDGDASMEHAPFPYTPSRSRSAPEPPSIEDIALGLHLSRTPHLRKPRRNVSLPPPGPISSPSHPRSPLPSALKNSSSPVVHTYPITPKSADSQSTSTLITTSPPTDSVRTGPPKARPGITRFFRLRTASTAPSSTSSTAADQDQQVEVGKTKKAVRFSSSTLDLNDGLEKSSKPDVA